MDMRLLTDGLITYLCLVILITFHEFGHAWMASKRGDDTARMLGRVSLNPLVHMDLLGTVILPLLAVFLSVTGSGLAGLIMGGGKPVPVHSANLKNRNVDWVLVAMAGPAMNVLLGAAAVAAMRMGMALESPALWEFCLRLAVLNFYLCFFNSLPIPPLDGSHLLRYFIGMTEERFLQISQYGFFILIFVIQIEAVRWVLREATYGSIGILASLFGVGRIG